MSTVDLDDIARFLPTTPIVDRWREFAADPMLTEALVQFLCAREGCEYVPQGSGGHPNWADVEGLRGAARDWIQHTVRERLMYRAGLPCEYVGGDRDDWATLTVCPESRADSGRSLYCGAHTERVRAGDRGVVYGRDSVIEYQRTGVIPTVDDWEGPA